MRLIRPRGAALRTVAPKSIPGKVRSSTYCARPVTLDRPSRRGIDSPMEGIYAELYSGLLEGLARLHVAAIEAATKPGDSLFGRTVGKAIRRDPRS